MWFVDRFRSWLWCGPHTALCFSVSLQCCQYWWGGLKKRENSSIELRTGELHSAEMIPYQSPLVIFPAVRGLNVKNTVSKQKEEWARKWTLGNSSGGDEHWMLLCSKITLFFSHCPLLQHIYSPSVWTLYYHVTLRLMELKLNSIPPTSNLHSQNDVHCALGELPVKMLPLCHHISIRFQQIKWKLWSNLNLGHMCAPPLFCFKSNHLRTYPEG